MLIGLQLAPADLMGPDQIEQQFEHPFQPDVPVGHRGAADRGVVALENHLQPIQRQSVGVLIILATKYIAFRASSLPLIKAGLAEKGCSFVKNRNAEQGQA